MPAMVLDASCGVKWALPEVGSSAARELVAAYASGRVDLWAPDLYVAEVTNIVWKKCLLLREMTPEDATRALAALLATLPELAASSTLAAQALQLGLKLGISTYDALYAALALQLGCALVTENQRLLERAAPVLGRVFPLSEAVARIG